ncbi:MAG TPA: DUF3180 family protein [Actinomyces sp.]|nr:DUF3180 family protein [Acidobacteriota bacterium]HHT40135.1 DUF3180 family protein [Actinomyces sp.]
MKPLSLPRLLIPATIFAAVGVVLLLVFPTIMFTPFTGLIFVLVAATLFYFGRKVVAFKEKEDTSMTATGAMNVAMFAYSSAWVSAATIGFFVGALISMTRYMHADYVRASMLGAVLSGAGAIILLIVAIIVERWCQLDDDDEQPPSSGLEQKAG